MPARSLFPSAASNRRTFRFLKPLRSATRERSSAVSSIRSVRRLRRVGKLSSRLRNRVGHVESHPSAQRSALRVRVVLSASTAKSSRYPSSSSRGSMGDCRALPGCEDCGTVVRFADGAFLNTEVTKSRASQKCIRKSLIHPEGLKSAEKFDAPGDQHRYRQTPHRSLNQDSQNPIDAATLERVRTCATGRQSSTSRFEDS